MIHQFVYSKEQLKASCEFLVKDTEVTVEEFEKGVLYSLHNAIKFIKRKMERGEAYATDYCYNGLTIILNRSRVCDILDIVEWYVEFSVDVTYVENKLKHTFDTVLVE